MAATIWYKRLAPNDTGAATGNMAGFLVPQALLAIFPELVLREGAHPSASKAVHVELVLNGVHKGAVADANFQYQTWGGTRTPEHRLTNGLDPILSKASGGDLITIEVLEPDQSYRLEVLSAGSKGYLDAMGRRISKAGSRGDWGVLRSAEIPVSREPTLAPFVGGEPDSAPRVFATLAHGFDPEVWAAFGFSLESVRNKLAAELRNGGGLLLSIGTMGEETPEFFRGKLLALHQLGTRPTPTGELVEPNHWASHLEANGGRPKWPFGLPILGAQRFLEPLSSRADLLPRLHDQNLHQKLASNYEPLTDDEAAVVLALPRATVTNLWRTRALDFTAGLSNPPAGPKPSPGKRTLTTISGPAATYCFELAGGALDGVVRTVAPPWSGRSVFKVGFSNNPARRLNELNAYFPDQVQLHWKHRLVQWHVDEINAWAMEQMVFSELRKDPKAWLRGEIYAVRSDIMNAAWTAALTNAQRPDRPIFVETDG